MAYSLGYANGLKMGDVDATEPACPVMVPVPVELLRAVLKCGRECAEDLAAELDQRHGGRDQYPTAMRRYERDMSAPRELKDVLRSLQNLVSQ